MTHINATSAAMLDASVSLTALVARRDCLRAKVGILQDFLEEASDLFRRALRAIRIHSTVAVSEQRKALDTLARELRQLGSRIQQRNWLAELQQVLAA